MREFLSDVWIGTKIVVVAVLILAYVFLNFYPFGMPHCHWSFWIVPCVTGVLLLAGLGYAARNG